MIFKGNVNVITRDSKDITMGYLQIVTITENGIYTSNTTKGEKKKIDNILKELKTENFIDSAFIIEGESRRTFQLQVRAKSSTENTTIGEVLKEPEQMIESPTVKKELFELINRIWDTSFIFRIEKSTYYFVFDKHEIIVTKDEANTSDFSLVWQESHLGNIVVYIKLLDGRKYYKEIYIGDFKENEIKIIDSDIRKCRINPEVFFARAQKEAI